MKGVAVVSRYSFEIIRRGFDRFSWVFVEVCDGRRRVLARADRDFRKKKQARRAVCALQDAVADAEIIDATGGNDPSDLPATSFEIAPYALPLVVGPPPITRAVTGGRRRRSRARRSADDGAAVEVEVAAARAPADAAGPPAAVAATKAAAAADAPRAARGRGAGKGARRTTAAGSRGDR